MDHRCHLGGMDVPYEPPSEVERRELRRALYSVVQEHVIEVMKAEIRRAVGVFPSDSERVPREVAIGKTELESRGSGVLLLTAS